jgi:hypothetical protein
MDLQRTYCEGCLRSIDEIRVWRGSSDLEKKAIWALIAERAVTVGPAHSPVVPSQQVTL